MSDINQRLAMLERVAKNNKASSTYKELYPVATFEFTKLEKQQGKDGKILTEIWHGLIDEYEQAHLDELREHLQANPNCPPPWRMSMFGGLLDRVRNGDNETQTNEQKRWQRDYDQLTKQALERYKQYESEGKI